MPVVGVDRADHVPQVAPGLGVEAGGRLVQEDDLGVVHQGERDRQPLLLAAGQAPRVAVGLGLEPDQLQRPIGERSAASGRGRSGRTARAARAPSACRRGRWTAAGRRSGPGSRADRATPAGPAARPRRRRACAGPRSSRAWSSCRRRSARGCRTTRPARPRTRRVDGDVVAVALGQPGDRDGVVHRLEP